MNFRGNDKLAVGANVKNIWIVNISRNKRVLYIMLIELILYCSDNND
jgi:hypothetical protein